MQSPIEYTNILIRQIQKYSGKEIICIKKDREDKPKSTDVAVIFNQRQQSRAQQQHNPAQLQQKKIDTLRNQLKHNQMQSATKY